MQTLFTWLMALSAASLPLMQALTVNIGFPLKIYEVTTALAFLAYIGCNRFDWPKLWRLQTTLLAFLIAYCVGVLFYRKDNPVTGFSDELIIQRFSPTIDSLLKLGYFALNVIALLMFAEFARRKPSTLVNAWLWGAVGSAVYSIYLATSSGLKLPTFILPGITEIQYFSHDIIRNGTFLEGNYAGLYFLISMCLAWGARHYWKAGIIFIGLFSTFSTQGLLLLMIYGPVALWRLARKYSPAWRLTLLFINYATILVASVVFLVSPLGKELVIDKLFAPTQNFSADDPTFSREDRIDTAQVGLQLFNLAPWTGVGISQYPYYHHAYSLYPSPKPEYDRAIPNNIYVEVLCEMGLIGASLFFLFLALTWVGIKRVPSVVAKDGYWLILLFWFAFPTFSIMYVWAYWGLLLGLSQRQMDLAEAQHKKDFPDALPRKKIFGWRLSDWSPLPLKFLGVVTAGCFFLVICWHLVSQHRAKNSSTLFNPNPSADNFFVGINGHPFAQVVYRDISWAEQMQWLQQLGIKWYRCDWYGYANLDEIDQLVELARQRGVTLLPVLFPNIDLDQETDLEKIYQTARQETFEIVSRYRDKISVWELHNELDNWAMVKLGEPDGKGSIWRWGNPEGDSPHHFNQQRAERAVALLKGMSDGVRQACPQARRIINTGGWRHYGFLEILKTHQVDYEIIGWHWYSEMGDISDPSQVDVLSELEKFGKEIWLTEGNRREGSMGGKEQEQADYLLKTLDRFRSLSPRIRNYFIYELFDEPHLGTLNPESYYGLIKVKKQAGRWTVDMPKPSFFAVENWMKATAKN